MKHLPINHHLRPVYRAIAALTGLYLLVFGIVGFAKTSSLAFFAQDSGVATVLGLRPNPAGAVLSIVLGALLLVAVVLGRNIDVYMNLAVCVVLILVGTAMVALLRTDLNVLNFSMSNVAVFYTLSMVLMMAALYGKTGSAEEEAAEEIFRHSH